MERTPNETKPCSSRLGHAINENTKGLLFVSRTLFICVATVAVAAVAVAFGRQGFVEQHPPHVAKGVHSPGHYGLAFQVEELLFG